MTSPWLDLDSAAQHVHRSPRTVERWGEEGKVPTYYPDRKPLFKAEELDRYIESKKRKNHFKDRN